MHSEAFVHSICSTKVFWRYARQKDEGMFHIYLNDGMSDDCDLEMAHDEISQRISGLDTVIPST